MNHQSRFTAPLPSVKAALLCAAFVLGLGGCAQFPSLDRLVRLKPVSDYQTTSSLSAPASTWPDERWWQTYRDPQLDALIDEALRDSPDMAAAAARLRRAEAFSQISGAALLPQASANASVSEQKQSYNHLIPQAALPQGWNDYGQVTLNFNWELDFWGKNHAALASATSQLEATRAELAQARLSLAAAVATNYAELARLFATRDTVARSTEIRNKTVALFDKRFANGLETRGSLSEAKARMAGTEGELLMIDEQISLQRNRLAALLGAGPDRELSIQRPTVNLSDRMWLPRAFRPKRRPTASIRRRPSSIPTSIFPPSSECKPWD